jgi:hypothetical protein
VEGVAISAFASRGVAAVGGVSGGAGGVGRSVGGDASMFSSGAVVVGVVAGKSGDGGGCVSGDGDGDLIVSFGDMGEKVGGETSRGWFGSSSCCLRSSSSQRSFLIFFAGGGAVGEGVAGRCGREVSVSKGGSVCMLTEFVVALPRLRRRWRRQRAGGGRAAVVSGNRQERYTSSYPAVFFKEKLACIPAATQRW